VVVSAEDLEACRGRRRLLLPRLRQRHTHGPRRRPLVRGTRRK
jgi:hypothetical protein